MATESRRLAIHQALFGSIAQFNCKLKRQRADYPDSDNDSPAPGGMPDCPVTPRDILPAIVRPSHRLDVHSKPYQKYLTRRRGFLRSLDTQHNFCRETQPRHPTSTFPPFVQTEVGLLVFQRIVDRVMTKADGYAAIHPRSPLKTRRRRRSFRRFDRFDQSTLRRIFGARDVDLTTGQYGDLAEMFEVRGPVEPAERPRLRRRRARAKAARLFTETQEWLQKRVNFYRQNRVRPYGLDPLQHDVQSPNADVTGESVSRYDVADLARLPALTLTVHTTGHPADVGDDVVVINELVQTDHVPRLVPKEGHIRERIAQAKFNS